MQSLEAELEQARDLSVSELADAIESIGFECTRCGACCTAESGVDGGDPGMDGDDSATTVEDDTAGEAHTATVFPDEVRTLRDRSSDDGSLSDEPREPADREAVDGGPTGGEHVDEWRDVARPMPYGLREDDDGDLEGETFEWALQTTACGDCVFYEEDEKGVGGCLAHEDRPLICRTYPFSVALAGTSQPMGEAVDEEGIVRAHECEGLGRDISRTDAKELADALKERAVRELEEAIAVRDNYDPASAGTANVVVHDSEGAKRIDGTPIEE
ncbi:YkgJ family cysteine cluster protein [Halostagnicola sp. A-GB9-2]|uniref:YkgJ family cysteine cluster protein n=1 Tax=Halostagnicola sp. A-GB9-2 TaxID=3048066 RepID=UPI0024BF53B2|nr:YkgJ family cysteine cluster protein [Halostagnicola sp. A-GB9-2]MDJ1431061.1 YkgJ family cysteine cluster protein [Halostagnicola sp. A-GB9-2]